MRLRMALRSCAKNSPKRATSYESEAIAVNDKTVRAKCRSGSVTTAAVYDFGNAFWEGIFYVNIYILQQLSYSLNWNKHHTLLL